MSTKDKKTPLANHRARVRAEGFLRVEVRATSEDAGLIRGVAEALRDPARAADVREALRRCLDPSNTRDFKQLLEAMPIDGLDLDRRRDLGRDIEL